MKNSVRDIVVEKKLRAQGLDPNMVKDLTKSIELRTIKLSKTGKEEEASFGEVFLTAYVFMMMMFFFEIQRDNWLLSFLETATRPPIPLFN